MTMLERKGQKLKRKKKKKKRWKERKKDTIIKRKFIVDVVFF